MDEVDHVGAFRRVLTKNTIVNCWHRSGVRIRRDVEALMWKLYGVDDRGVAICSTRARLVQSLPPRVDEVVALYGKRKPDGCPEALPVCVGEVTYIDYESEIFPDNNSYLPVESLYVAPTAPLWFVDLVQSVVDQYGFSFPVRSSALSGDPIF